MPPFSSLRKWRQYVLPQRWCLPTGLSDITACRPVTTRHKFIRTVTCCFYLQRATNLNQAHLPPTGYREVTGHKCAYHSFPPSVKDEKALTFISAPPTLR